jgi:hypothetical protein
MVELVPENEESPPYSISRRTSRRNVVADGDGVNRVLGLAVQPRIDGGVLSPHQTLIRQRQAFQEGVLSLHQTSIRPLQASQESLLATWMSFDKEPEK